jgi:hypothetical protein
MEAGLGDGKDEVVMQQAATTAVNKLVPQATQGGFAMWCNVASDGASERAQALHIP